MKIIPYEERFGEVRFPEGFEETLQNLTLEEQMDRYRITLATTDASTGWRKRTSAWTYIKLTHPAVKALIVKDGILVGIMLNDHNDRETACLAEERICISYECDNNGAGYKERYTYAYFLCVPQDFEK